MSELPEAPLRMGRLFAAFTAYSAAQYLLERDEVPVEFIQAHIRRLGRMTQGVVDLFGEEILEPVADELNTTADLLRASMKLTDAGIDPQRDGLELAAELHRNDEVD